MTTEQWACLNREGFWTGADVDRQDGYIHFSAWDQVLGTLEKHFAGQSDLLLIGVPLSSVESELKWEVSRGGQEFPHLYRELRTSDVGNRRLIDWDGRFRIGDELLDGDRDPNGDGERLANEPLGESEMPLRYPLYLLHHGPGYVSLVDVQSTAQPPPQALAVFSTYELAADFVEQMAGFAGIKAIKNAREFQWLLTSLKEPVVQVVLNPAIDRPEIVGVWRRTISELLERHIEIDNSPWNYPVYMLRGVSEGSPERSATSFASHVKTGGWSSIRAGASSHWFEFVVLFTSQKLAETYRSAIADEDGWLELISLADMWALRERLVDLGAEIAGVAVNPTFEAGVRKCDSCLEIGRLLEHYLVVARPAELARSSEQKLS